MHLFSPMRVTCPAHIILLDIITGIILGEEFPCHAKSETDPMSKIPVLSIKIHHHHHQHPLELNVEELI
jgi:hypothetical protein